ncbi:Coiled-coil domain-containing protein 60 [Heterocephalus glaber]|uniref:Coiled-coil domain-containing protein 60 n=1 Tax=Heterocephalus glaber TaxID=10181 RepID=G5C0Z1_HETGA|nr:Coiled-coil domain-containing protein 60 [Heterocephalus glaber]
MNPSATVLARRQVIGSEVENSTAEKQCKELQLLIGELKDRDKELSDMVAVHQRQLLSGEKDWQKALTLEERCSKLEGELHKRTEIARSLMKKAKVLESNQIEYLEDKDIIEVVTHIADCSGKFKLLEHASRDGKVLENSIVKEKQDYKQKLKALNIKVNKLKEDLNEKTTENNEQREEIIRLKQEKSCLHDELIFTVAREKRKDELLDIAKPKHGYLMEKPKSWPLGAKVPSEPESKITLSKVHAKSPKDDGAGRQGVSLGLAGCCRPRQVGKLDAKARELPARSGSLSFVKSQGGQDDRGLCEPADSTLSIEKDDCSPMSKLQRLLAESQQMVTDLELRMRLPLSFQDPSCSARSNLEISEESAEKNTFICP